MTTGDDAPVPAWLLLASTLVGPACLFSPAIRLEPRPSAGTPRHLLAGTATSPAVPGLAASGVRTVGRG